MDAAVVVVAEDIVRLRESGMPPLQAALQGTRQVGGILHDLLIGAVPPAALSDWRYPVIWLMAGLVAFLWSPLIEGMQHPVRAFDALGLAVFAVAGTDKALDAGLSPLMAPLLGMLSGISGGMLRDVLLARVPLVLQAELYAVAALAGAGVVALGGVLRWPEVPVAVAAAALCSFLRLAALRYGWHLPRALQAPPGDDAP